MASQGSGGAYEISQRMTAMVGWGATSDFREDWAWDQVGGRRGGLGWGGAGRPAGARGMQGGEQPQGPSGACACCTPARRRPPCFAQAAQTYALDAAMADKLRKANPQVRGWAWAGIAGRGRMGMDGQARGLGSPCVARWMPAAREPLCSAMASWGQGARTTMPPPPPRRVRAHAQAFANLLRRMLEAAGRGMWGASPEVLAQLKGLYSEMDDVLEGVRPTQ